MLDFIRVNTHSSIRIEDEKVIYIDPFKIENAVNDADIILITHSHFDHFSPDDIRKVMKSDTILVCPASMNEADEMGLSAVKVIPYEQLEINGISIETVPAYNNSKPFHPKNNNWVGYIINIKNNGRIYIAGDTDATEDNKKVKCDIALVPIGGTFTMTANEAAELINHIKPEYAIPVHYGSVAGKADDADRFRKSVNPEITVIEKIEKY